MSTENELVLLPLKKPVGEFILAQSDICPTILNGGYCHYTDVCTLLSRYTGLAWIPTTSGYPEKPGKQSYEHVPCICIHKGYPKLLMWNCEHLCWDDEDGDDYFCEPNQVDFYIPLIDLPKIPKKE